MGQTGNDGGDGAWSDMREISKLKAENKRLQGLMHKQVEHLKTAYALLDKDSLGMTFQAKAENKAFAMREIEDVVRALLFGEKEAVFDAALRQSTNSQNPKPPKLAPGN